MFLIWLLAYIAVASIAMYWTVRLDKLLPSWPRLDDRHLYTIIACLWPIAFPIFYAYFMAHVAKEDE